MGDRTSVMLQVLRVDADRAREIIEPIEGEADQEDDPDGTSLLFDFHFNDVNYGNLNCLEDLQEAGIPHDSSWESGGDYGPGCQSCRFTDTGGMIVNSVAADEVGISTAILMPHIDDHEKLKALIREHHGKVSNLPWDNQEEYAALYRTLKLIHAEHS